MLAENEPDGEFTRFIAQLRDFLAGQAGKTFGGILTDLPTSTALFAQ